MRLRTMLPMLALGLLLASPSPAETLRGTVDAADPTQVTVSGRKFRIEPESELLDAGGSRIAVGELVSGTPVELELDDQGALLTLHARLVR
jgi:hypothetical protein